MDVIQQLIEGTAAMLAKIFLGRHTIVREIVVEKAMDADDLSKLLDKNLLEGSINKAENILFEQLEIYPTIDIYKTGLEFFEKLNAMSDEKLAGYSYSREEIVQGIHDMTNLLIKITKYKEIPEEDL